MKALTRTPSREFSLGQTTRDLGQPDQGRALRQHQGYCAALTSLGVEVTTLAPDRFPDSCFIEDTALVVDAHTVVLTRPGHDARLPERAGTEAALRELFPEAKFHRMERPARLDGGDVLRVGQRWFVGQSGRTNQRGYQDLTEVLGGRCLPLAVPRGVLHLKSACSALSEDLILTIPELAPSFEAQGLRTLLVDAADPHGANVLVLGRSLILPTGRPAIAALLRSHGFQPVEVELSEFEKQDGGVTCLSLLI